MSTLPPAAVLRRYGPVVAGLRWSPVAGGGFSGAAVWRGDETAGPVLALKAYPPTGMTADRLARTHGWQDRVATLPFVPSLARTTDGATFTEHAGRLWEVSRWMPGVADFRERPSPVRVANACATLAALPRFWPPVPPPAPAPGVLSRLRVLADFRSANVGTGGNALLERGREQVRRLTPAAEAALLPWANRPLTLRPCLCDVWHDHVLFTGDAVSGVIDYGAMKVDHVAVDPARLLGSLVPDDPAAFAAGLAAYRAAGGPLDVPDDFVRLLARTGDVCAVAVWLLRLNGGPVAPPVAARLAALVARLSSLPAGNAF